MYALLLQEFEQLLTQSKKTFEISNEIQMKLQAFSKKSQDKQLDRSSFKVLLNRKLFVVRQNIKRRHLQLIFIINKMVCKL